MAGGEEGEIEGGDGAQTGAQAVHVVGQVQGVGDSQDPEDGDEVTEEGAGNEEGDADAGGGDGKGDQGLEGELERGTEFRMIVPGANTEHGGRPEEDGGELGGASTEAVGQSFDGDGIDPMRGDGDHAGEKDGEEAGEQRPTAGQWDGGRMDLAMARVINPPPALAEVTPERNGEGGGKQGAEAGEEIGVGRKGGHRAT